MTNPQKTKTPPNTPQIDDRLRLAIDHMMRSPRMRAATIALSERVNMLDALERAGFVINNAKVLVILQGREVRTVLTPADGLDIEGGGFVKIDRSEKP